jgi:hypothetical protein
LLAFQAVFAELAKVEAITYTEKRRAPLLMSA